MTVYLFGVLCHESGGEPQPGEQPAGSLSLPVQLAEKCGPFRSGGALLSCTLC